MGDPRLYVAVALITLIPILFAGLSMALYIGGALAFEGALLIMLFWLLLMQAMTTYYVAVNDA